MRHDGLAAPVPYAAGWHRHLDFLRAHLAGHDLPMDRFGDGFDALLALIRWTRWWTLRAGRHGCG